MLDLWTLGFVGLALALSIFDFKYEILPDPLTLALAALGVWKAVLAGEPQNALFGAALAGGLLFLVRAYFALRHKYEGMGFGDVKLAAALGLWTGGNAAPWFIVVAAVLGLGLAAGLQRKRIPFGPCLLFAAVPFL